MRPSWFARNIGKAIDLNPGQVAGQVAHLDSYLRAQVGGPTTSVASPKAGHFGGQQGIICFEVSGWSDATGHFDLWNGTECAGSEYFAMSHQAHLWCCP